MTSPDLHPFFRIPPQSGWLELQLTARRRTLAETSSSGDIEPHEKSRYRWACSVCSKQLEEQFDSRQTNPIVPLTPRLMNYTLIGVVIVLVLAAMSYFAYPYLIRRHVLGGFHDWVKNPAWKQAAADYFAERDAVDVPDDISDTEIQNMVDRLFVRENQDFNFERLELVGAKAVPFLIAALTSNTAVTASFGPGGHCMDARSSFERICELLEPFGPAEAAGPLALHVNHQDNDIRKLAARASANIGTAECIAPTINALTDEDDYVRSNAMTGIQVGMEAQRCTPDFLAAMFPPLVTLLNRSDSSISGTAPRLLLAIDAERALPVLLSDTYFTPDNRQLHYIIRALNAAKLKISHVLLLPLLKTLRPLVDEYPHDYEYADALKAYVANPDASTEILLRAELESPNKRVRETAADALATLAGVTNARDVVLERIKKSGIDSLTHQQRHYYAAFIYDAEVRNGGHSQYFVNSSGNHWKDALEGLIAMGAAGRAEILKSASALFGSNGPPTDNDQRHALLARFSAKQEKTLDELDTAYYASNESLEILLSHYTIQHKHDFTSRP